MVRPIIVKDDEKIFYGTREAFYGLSLESDTVIKNFARDLESQLFSINNREFLDGDHFLYFRIGQRCQMFFPEEVKEENKAITLQKALMQTPNIQINVGDFMVANLISRFDSDNKSRKKPRGLEIIGHSIPNKYIHFDSSCLYELGEKYGKLETGVDFEIAISNHIEINNRR